MKQRIGKVIDWWCTGSFCLYLVLLAIQWYNSAPADGILLLAVFMGVPTFLAFLVGKSIRYILS